VKEAGEGTVDGDSASARTGKNDGRREKAKRGGTGETTRERQRKREREREREAGTVHADTREITAFAYVWIHRSSERASANGRPGFIGLLQARRGMESGSVERTRGERKEERERRRKRERQG